MSCYPGCYATRLWVEVMWRKVQCPKLCALNLTKDLLQGDGTVENTVLHPLCLTGQIADPLLKKPYLQNSQCCHHLLSSNFNFSQSKFYEIVTAMPVVWCKTVISLHLHVCGSDLILYCNVWNLCLKQCRGRREITLWIVNITLVVVDVGRNMLTQIEV